MGHLPILLLALLAVGRASAIESSSNLSVTVYGSFAVVKDTRNMSFDSGVSSLSFSDVATTINPETVMFTPRKDVSVEILEQNYENYLASKEALLKSCVDQVISVDAGVGASVKTYTGKLYAYSPAIILGTVGGVVVINSADVIQVKSLPDSMLLKPALVWKVRAAESVRTECEVAYRAGGFSWKADYILTLSEAEDLGSFAGWVTIDNNSGKKYVDTGLKLVAGDVNIAQPPQARPPIMYAKSMALAADASFEEKAFGDYHMYTLPRRVTINEASKKQIEFLPRADTILVDKYLVLQISAGGYTEADLKAKSTVAFRNSAKDGLGLPLPKGTVRVFKQDTDESLEFVGEDSIQHTPREENLTLGLGTAFDLTAKKTALSRANVANGYDAKLKLEVNNRGDKPAKIKVEFNNYYADRLDLKTTSALFGNVLVKESASKYVLFATLPANKSSEYQWTETYRSA